MNWTRGRICARGNLAWIVLATVALHGCMRDHPDLVRILNDAAIPVSIADHQLAAVTSAAASLENLTDANVYIGIGVNDLRASLERLLSTGMAAVGASGILTNAELEFGQQALHLRADFELEVSDPSIRLSGTAHVACAAAVENSVLVLRPAATHAVLSAVKYRGRYDVPLISSAINAALARFLMNLNGVVEQQRVPLDLHRVSRIDPKQLAKDMPELSELSATPLSINLALGRSAVLLDAAGVHVLADLVVLTPSRMEAILAELGEIARAPSPVALTSAQLAVLAQCGSETDPAVAWGAHFISICSTLKPRTQVVTSTPTGGDPAVVVSQRDAAYADFRKNFMQKTALVEAADNLDWSATALAISRRALAEAVNEVFADVALRARVALPSFTGQIEEKDKTIYLPPASDLKCDDAGGACESTFSFRPYVPKECPGDCCQHYQDTLLGRVCTSVDLGCAARKPVCEGEKEAERLAYEGEKAAEQGKWQIRKLACESVKAGKIQGCKLNQEWLNAWGGQDVGEVRGAFSVDGVVASIGIDQFRIGPDFDTLSVNTNVSGEGSINADITVVPHNVGTIVCVAQWSAAISIKAGIPPRADTLTATRSEVEQAGDDLLLSFKLDPLDIAVKFDPPPIAALLAQKGAELALKCPLPAATLALLAGFSPVNILVALPLRNEILRDAVTFKFKGAEVVVPIIARTVVVNSRTIKIVPEWTPQAVVFTARGYAD